MFDENYLKAEDTINQARYRLKKLLENSSTKGLENSTAYREIEYILEMMEDTEKSLEYLSKPTKEGKLIESDGGKFYIVYDDGTESYLLSCGNNIEVYLKEDLEEDVEEGWHIGRVEHTTRNGQEGYYFYGANKPFLYHGMRARKRIER